MTNRITVKRVDIEDNRVTVSFSCKGKIKNYFTQNIFFAEYNTSIQSVPEAVLIIPFLACVSPVAWANQADIFIEKVDKTFLNSLGHVQKTLQKFYPKMKFSGQVYFRELVTPAVKVQTNSMMLYSGGIDALTTYVRHQAEKPILVRVHGSDININDSESWRRLIGNITASFSTTIVTLRTIRSNFLEIVDLFLLREYHPRISGTWQNKVMHGMALLGLCAPLTYVDKVGKLYIASSFTDKVEMPYGSHPEIDNYVRWTGTKAIHDGYELSRQEKVEFLADYLNNKNPTQYIHTCLTSKSDKNCGRCEKCSRTMIGLELAGIDPAKHGFPLDKDTFARIKSNLAEGIWRFDDQLPMWIELKKQASRYEDLPHPEARVLIDWLLTADVESLRAHPTKPSLVFFLLKYLPHPIYRLAKRFYIEMNKLLT